MSTTVSTTTIEAALLMELTAYIGLVLTLGLIAFLIGKELAAASDEDTVSPWGRILNVAVAPLLICFAVIVIVRAAESF